MDSSLAIATPLEQAAKTIFKRVLDTAKTSKNTGKVAICCYSFFTRAKAESTDQHETVISAREFCKQYQIKTEMDFINHCKSQHLLSDPQLNGIQCRKKDKKTEEILVELKAEIASLKARLDEKDRLLANYPVDCCEQADEGRKVEVQSLRTVD